MVMNPVTELAEVLAGMETGTTKLLPAGDSLRFGGQIKAALNDHCIARLYEFKVETVASGVRVTKVGLKLQGKGPVPAIPLKSPAAAPRGEYSSVKWGLLLERVVELGLNESATFKNQSNVGLTNFVNQFRSMVNQSKVTRGHKVSFSMDRPNDQVTVTKMVVPEIETPEPRFQDLDLAALKPGPMTEDEEEPVRMESSREVTHKETTVKECVYLPPMVDGKVVEHLFSIPVGGGHLDIGFRGSLMALSPANRNFVFGIVDRMKFYAEYGSPDAAGPEKPSLPRLSGNGERLYWIQVPQSWVDDVMEQMEGADKAALVAAWFRDVNETRSPEACKDGSTKV